MKKSQLVWLLIAMISPNYGQAASGTKTVMGKCLSLCPWIGEQISLEK